MDGVKKLLKKNNLIGLQIMLQIVQQIFERWEKDKKHIWGNNMQIW